MSIFMIVILISMLCFLGLKTTKEYFTCGSCSGSSCSFTPPSVLKNNSMNDKNSGNLDPIDDSSCLKMGLCTQYKTISDLKKYNLPYLTPSGIKFVSAPINTNIDNICPNGYITDGVNLHQGCANQSNGLYICKYFTNLN